MSALSEPRPIGELFSELASETATLVRHEVDLARIEMTAKARAASRDAVKVGAGALVGYLGVSALIASLIFGLAEAMPLWAAALIIGLLVTAGGGALLMVGLRHFRQLDAAPRQTLQTLQEDKQWLREQVSR